jgi:hypothetical protein
MKKSVNKMKNKRTMNEEQDILVVESCTRHRLQNLTLPVFKDHNMIHAQKM